MAAAAGAASSGAAAAFAVRDLRAYLRGAWRCERALKDAGVAARFSGVARFSEGAVEGGGGAALPPLAYREEGTLTLEAGGASPATRAYEYTFPRSAAAAEVLFDDGRHFHPLDLTQGAWSATHLCGDDVYEGEWVAVGRDEWTMTWRVKGPRKDQVLRTTFFRGVDR